MVLAIIISLLLAFLKTFSNTSLKPLTLSEYFVAFLYKGVPPCPHVMRHYIYQQLNRNNLRNVWMIQTCLLSLHLETKTL